MKRPLLERFYNKPALSNFFKQAEIFIPGNPRRFEIVMDDGYWNFILRGDHHGAKNACFDVGTIPHEPGTTS